ncbi:tripartite tricarboxylate transporter substrate binding protein [Roseomonas sp. PWR1]|uniref:Tripartite tricarboxylate transporter substrate binding protein n=1 Tax=Roseomonas nitratireducens TaxID=2820810 RepID=A0ABS4AXX0_9PROT|nr:tripartite tricarboxylate transporter substrate binding protein [Neoroseomonas nitratireducens]MBP0465581.1 tripartite tricarboxylate transporter substrate binding protein [Neoroseomonas nitratireducens]
MTLRRRPLLFAAAALAAPAPLAAQGAPWPQRPVRLIVPYAASGGTDILARATAEALRPALPHPIIVENRAGAAGVVGSEVVARAEPDGHTLLMVVSTHVMNRYHLPSMPFDPIRDFSPIAMLTRNTMVLVAGANQPFDSLRAMVEHAKRNPGRVGTGSTEALSSFIGQELARRAGVDMPDVAYRSGGQLMNDIVAGHLPTGWTSTVSAMPHIGTGRVRVLAVSTGTRTPYFPDAPTAAEQGVTDFDLSGWVALLGPPRMDPALVATIGGAVQRAFDDAAFQQRLVALGVERDFRPPAALLEAMQRDDRIWAAAAQAGHIRPQQ